MHPFSPPAPAVGACPGHRARHAGFSLLEVLVAFAILAVSLGVLMQIFSRATLTTLAADAYSRAASLAESRLEAVGSVIPLEEGTVSGEPEDGFAWEVAILPTDLGLSDGFGFGLEPGLGDGLPATPYQVTVTVLWEDGGEVRRIGLTTLRLGPSGL